MMTSENKNFTFETKDVSGYGFLGIIIYDSGYHNSFIQLYKACFYANSKRIPINTELLNFIQEIREHYKTTS